MIRAITLSAERGEKVLFEKLSFNLKEGHCLSIEGPNGSGKSTLLKLLAGLRLPQSGKILRGGAVFYLSHQLALHSALTVTQNLKILTEIHASTLSSDLKIKRALKVFEIEDLADQLCGCLSGGQLQRVALSGLLLTDAPVWILDEPFNSLDKVGEEILNRCLNEHLSRSGALVIAMHQQFAIALKPESLTRLRLGIT